MTKATAVILTYNRREMLATSLAAALAQTHPDLEVLVVDNGSTDGTREWLASVHDPRLRVLTLEENVNPTVARNRALDAMTGEWVGFCDDDDLWAPTKVELMLAAAAEAGARWVYCGCVYLDPAGVVVAGRPPSPRDMLLAALPVAYTIPGGLSGVMWHKDALDGDGRLDESMTYTDDWDVALRLLQTGTPAVVSEPLVGFRQHGGSWSRRSDRQRHEYDRIAQKHAVSGDGSSHLVGWRHQRYVAAEAARSGARLEAVRHYLEAIRQGDLGSVPRLLGVLLPAGMQRWLRRVVLSDIVWMAKAESWVRAVHPIPEGGSGRPVA